MNKILTNIKNAAITNTWLVYLALCCFFLVSPNPLSWKNFVLVGGTFVLNLYKDKVRDKLKELERNL